MSENICVGGTGGVAEGHYENGLDIIKNETFGIE